MFGRGLEKRKKSAIFLSFVEPKNGQRNRGMDKTVIDALVAAGADYEFKTTGISIPIQVPDNDDSREPIPLEDQIYSLSGEIIVPGLWLKKIPDLFTGHRQPPSFKHGPTIEYVHFFSIIELTVIDFCAATKRIERDVEIERLYNLLRRHPAGKDPNPLFSYIQGAARLYMSLRDVSQAEFEGVASRLARSAKTFSEGPTSRNYFDIIGKSFRGEL